MKTIKMATALLVSGFLALASAQDSSLTLQEVGFSTPESVLHDEAADVYLVSNISGAPLEENGEGFISRVSPSGEVLELRWIDGQAEGVTLNAPKGMALVNDTLYVADIDMVRMFHRESGEALGNIPIEGSGFLNDVASGPDGAVYVSDTGLDANLEPTGTDAIYRINPDGTVTTVIAGAELGLPNGLAVLGPGELVVVTFGPGENLYTVNTERGERENARQLPVDQLDGVVVLPNGDLLISSWGASSVVRVTPDGEVTTVAEDVTAPADIGVDATRNRLLIPLFMDDEVVFLSLSQD